MILASILLGIATLLAIATPRALAADDDKDWKILGDATIEKQAATEEIKVGGEEGLVKRIKFEARGADIEFKKITIAYENGDPEQIDVRDKVRRGGRTRAIDLKGGNRVIKKVVVALKVDKDADRDARIILLGHK
jgi:hypothetical protein